MWSNSGVRRSTKSPTVQPSQMCFWRSIIANPFWGLTYGFGADPLPQSRNLPSGVGRINPIIKNTFRALLPILPGGIVYVDSHRRWFTTIAFMSRACTPRTGGKSSAGYSARFAFTCLKRQRPVIKADSTRKTFVSRVQLSKIWRFVFVVIARYASGLSHLICERSTLSEIFISMENGDNNWIVFIIL